MPEDSEQEYLEIKERLKKRLMAAVETVRELSEEEKENRRNFEAAQGEVQKAGEDALDELDKLRDAELKKLREASHP